MSYPLYSNEGDVNYCYLYLRHLEQCYQDKIFPKTNCSREQEDFMECHNSKKYSQNMGKVEAAMAATKHLKIPIYDPETDQFTIIEPKIQKIANDDPMFKNYKWL